VDEAALFLYAQAAALYNDGKFDEAITLLDGMAAQGIRFAPAIALCGKAHHFAGDSVRAEARLREAVALENRTDDALFLARLLLGKGEAEEAMGIVHGLLADDPHNTRTLRLAAEISRVRGRTADYLLYLNRAAAGAVDSALVMLERARTHWRIGATEAALADIEAARALTEADSPLYRAITNLEKTIRGRMRDENEK
jgi:predicted Zn-dependent protease